MTKREWLHAILWHMPLDWYCNKQWLGWGLIQVGQWHICNRFEYRQDRRARRLEERGIDHA